ncbi:MAG: 4-(cytidine 5'-diphospho)-2-C-methyl-D-erythritol kinase [Acidimicrobiales bacterium]
MSARSIGPGSGPGPGPGSGRGGTATVLLAPAKLTVSLRVVGFRPDGYHELEAEMVSLDLADQLEIDPGGDGLEVVAEPGSGIEVMPDAGDDNLVRRALAAVGRRAHVRLRKRIPVGGGLGGGSSDAAAVLRWAGVRDLAVAARLGADVPFCVHGGRALVRGIGESVAPREHVDRSFVLLLPPFGVDTGAVYREWDQRAMRRESTRDLRRKGPVNDLTAPALTAEPRLRPWSDRFGEVTGREPSLAGSGSTWWVEGTPSELGLDGQATLRLGAEEGRLLAVRTVPSGWTGTGVGPAAAG